MPRKNFFIFQTKDENFDIVISKCLYGADISRPEQRPLCNSKPGDLVFIWNIDERSLYGPFEIASPLFYDDEEVGWTKNWPYRVLIRPWGSTIFEISSKVLPSFISFLADKMITIKDISDIIMGRRFLLSLIYEEGISLLRFLLSEGEPANELLKNACSDRYKPKEAFLAMKALKNYAGIPPEYLIELYLLQQLEELELLVGSGISDVYNTLYGYAGRFLDILTVHRAENGSILKLSILELKKNQKNMERGLEELAHYMFWASDKFPGIEISRVFGILISPSTWKPLEEFKNLVEKYADMYGLRARNFSWLTYKLDNSSGRLLFTKI